MKRLIIPGSLSVVALLAIATPPPAYATVTVVGSISKTKDITVNEQITISKAVDVLATVSLRADRAAEADTVDNQVITNDFACGNCSEKLDWINGSINNNIGAVSVNQAAGNNNNQANGVTAAVDDYTPPGNTTPPPSQPLPGLPGGFAQAQAAVDQRIGLDGGAPVGEATVDPNYVNTVNVLFRTAEISGSVNDNLGVIAVNEATGNMNNQTNTLTLALSLSGGVALSEADLGQANANNQVHEASVVKTSAIADSISGNYGIVGVNQTSGNFANQANVVALAAAVQVSP